MKRRGAVRTIAFVLLLLCHSIAPAGERKGLRILISNDDGIEAPGIAALFDALSRLGTVTVAAPSQGRSATSHGIVTDGPILVRESERKGARWYSIDALPATCVRLALESLLDTPPDIVVSGVNRGENLGVVTFYSATVACAREAAFKGIPAVAVSLESGPDMDYAAAAEAAALVIEKSPLESWPKGLYLNINAPARKRGRLQGLPRRAPGPPGVHRALRGTGQSRGNPLFLALLRPSRERRDHDRHPGRPRRVCRDHALPHRPDRPGRPRGHEAARGPLLEALSGRNDWYFRGGC